MSDVTGRSNELNSFSIALRFFRSEVFFAILLVFVCTTILAEMVGELEWYRSKINWYFGALAVVFLIFSNEKNHAFCRAYLSRFAAFLRERGAFVSNPVEEAPKFALLRFVFGLLIAQRAVWILYYLSASDWGHTSIWFVSAIYPIIGLFIAIGFLTQFSLAFLVFFQWSVGDLFLGTATLGNNIGTTLAVLLMLSNAGASFSLDAYILRTKSLLQKMVSFFYYRDGLPSADTLQIIKFMTLFAYWCTCLYSLAMHLGEPAWMNGIAGPLLLTNSFMSRFSSEFAALFSMGTFPVMIARILLWAMLPWYLLIVPFVLLGGWFRRYIIIWSVLFFLLSKFVLQLGWLAEFEFIFFAGLFWQKTFISGEKSLQVAYDDKCNLCDRTVQFVKVVDIFRRVELRPLSQNQQWLATLGIDPEDARKDLYAVDAAANKPPVKGYDFYLLLSRYVLLLLPFYPFLLLGKYLGGPAVYRFVADRRTQMFGVCQIPSKKADYLTGYSSNSGIEKIGSGDPIVPIFAHFVFFAMAFIIALPTPYLADSVPLAVVRVQTAMSRPAGAILFYGTTPIDVFNHTDLRLAENWFTISQVDESGKETILPIISENGARLGGHRSDKLYFGNALFMRRSMIGTVGCQFDRFRSNLNYLLDVFKVRDGKYIYRQYHQPLPDMASLQKNIYLPTPRTSVCESSF